MKSVHKLYARAKAVPQDVIIIHHNVVPLILIDQSLHFFSVWIVVISTSNCYEAHKQYYFGYIWNKRILIGTGQRLGLSTIIHKIDRFTKPECYFCGCWPQLPNFKQFFGLWFLYINKSPSLQSNRFFGYNNCVTYVWSRILSYSVLSHGNKFSTFRLWWRICW